MPDGGADVRFERRVQRWERRRRASAIALVVAIAGSVGAAVAGSLRSTTHQPASPSVVRLAGGAVTIHAPEGWTVQEAPGRATLTHDLPSGGQIEVFAWDLGDGRLHPIDPTTGEVGPAAAPFEWFDRFADREGDLPEFPERSGFVSAWTTDDAMPLLWLLSVPGVDPAGVERSDYRIDEHFAPRTAFDLPSPVDVLAVSGGNRIQLPAGRIWSWYSPLADVHTIIGYRVPTDADPSETSALFAELARGIELPSP